MAPYAVTRGGSRQSRPGLESVGAAGGGGHPGAGPGAGRTCCGPATWSCWPGRSGPARPCSRRGSAPGSGCRGAVTSPTFVLARVHRGGRLPLVHVDAYRLGSVEEVDDLDLDADLPESVTVVEWGHGLVEQLADAHLLVRLDRAADRRGAHRRAGRLPAATGLSGWPGWRSLHALELQRLQHRLAALADVGLLVLPLAVDLDLVLAAEEEVDVRLELLLRPARRGTGSCGRRPRCPARRWSTRR